MPAPPRSLASSPNNNKPSSTPNRNTNTRLQDPSFDPNNPPVWTSTNSIPNQLNASKTQPPTTSRPTLPPTSTTLNPSHTQSHYPSSSNPNNPHLTSSITIPQHHTPHFVQLPSHNSQQSHSIPSSNSQQIATMADHPFAKQQYDPRYNSLVTKNHGNPSNTPSTNIQHSIQPDFRNTAAATNPPQNLQAFAAAAASQPLPSVSHAQIVAATHLTPDQVAAATATAAATAAATGNHMPHNGHVYSIAFPQATPQFSAANPPPTAAVQYANSTYAAAPAPFDPLLSSSIMPTQPQPHAQTQGRVVRNVNRTVNRSQQQHQSHQPQQQQVARSQNNNTQQNPNQKKQQNVQQIQSQQQHVRRQQITQNQNVNPAQRTSQQQTQDHNRQQSNQQPQQSHPNRRQNPQAQVQQHTPQSQQTQQTSQQQEQPVQRQMLKGHMIPQNLAVYGDQAQQMSQMRQLHHQQQQQRQTQPSQNPNQPHKQTSNQSQPHQNQQQQPQQARSQHPRQQSANTQRQQVIHRQAIPQHAQQRDLQNHTIQQQPLQHQMYQPLDQSPNTHHLMFNEGINFFQRQKQVAMENQVAMHNRVAQLQPNARISNQDAQFEHHPYPAQMNNMSTVGLHQQGDVSAQKGLSVSQQHELFGWGNNTTAGRNVANPMSQANPNEVAAGGQLLNPNGFPAAHLFEIGGVTDVRHQNSQANVANVTPGPQTAPPVQNVAQPAPKTSQPEAGSSSNVRKASPNDTGVSPRKRRQGNNGVATPTTRLSAIPGSRPFTCSTCGEEFAAKRDRDNHVRTNHERSFSCTQCPSKFKTKSDANRHIRIVHERRRPFQCPSCNSTFSERNKLRRHQDTVHEKKRPHICPVCSARFGELGNLRQHTTSLHPDVTIDPAQMRARAENNTQIQS